MSADEVICDCGHSHAARLLHRCPECSCTEFTRWTEPKLSDTGQLTTIDNLTSQLTKSALLVNSLIEQVNALKEEVEVQASELRMYRSMKMLTEEDYATYLRLKQQFQLLELPKQLDPGTKFSENPYDLSKGRKGYSVLDTADRKYRRGIFGGPGV